MSEIEGPRKRGKPLVRWEDRIKENILEGDADRGEGLEQTRRGCMDKERWRLFYCSHRIGGRSQRE